MAMVDRDLTNRDAALAAKVSLLPGMDVRLACIEAEEDKYHVLQGLIDPGVGSAGDPKCCYAYERWGSTGTRGQIKLEGPMEQPKVAAALAKVFEELTGSSWGSIAPGDRAPPGKYWVQQHMNPDFQAKWEYYVADGVDGKRTGWYPYVTSASEEVEELYAQHVANGCEARTAMRVIQSGHFSYKVDLESMTQQNTRTKTQRTIRRVKASDSSSVGSGPVPMEAAVKVRPMKAMKAPQARLMKAMKVAPMKAMKKPMKKAPSKVGKKWQVLKGLKTKTKGGQTQAMLIKNTKRNKVVSKKMHENGKKTFESNLKKWVEATKAARSALGLTGFVLMKKGTPFYAKTQELAAS